MTKAYFTPDDVRKIRDSVVDHNNSRNNIETWRSLQPPPPILIDCVQLTGGTTANSTIGATFTVYKSSNALGQPTATTETGIGYDWLGNNFSSTDKAIRLRQLGPGGMQNFLIPKGVGFTVSQNSTVVVTNPTDINFSTNLTAADDGDGSVTVSAVDAGGGGSQNLWSRIVADSGETTANSTVDVLTLQGDSTVIGSTITGDVVTYYHKTSGVTAGTYQNATVTVDDFGHVTAASSGSTTGGGTHPWSTMSDAVALFPTAGALHGIVVGSTAVFGNSQTILKMATGGSFSNVLALSHRGSVDTARMIDLYGPDPTVGASSDESRITFFMKDDSTTPTAGDETDFRETVALRSVLTSAASGSIDSRFAIAVTTDDDLSASGANVDRLHLDEDLHATAGPNRNADLFIHNGDLSAPGVRLGTDGTNVLTVDDTTNATTPFRIELNTPDDTMILEAATGDVGYGRQPTASIDCYQASGVVSLKLETAAASAQRIDFIGSNRTFRIATQGNGTLWNFQDITNSTIPFKIEDQVASDMCRITPNGVAINQAAATEDIDAANNGRFRGIGSGTSAGDLHYTSTGVLTTNTSDERLKTKRKPIKGAWRQLAGLVESGGVFSHEWAKNPPRDMDVADDYWMPGRHNAFGAQTVAEHIPSAAGVSKKGVYHVQTSKITPTIVQAVYELGKWIKAVADKLKIPLPDESPQIDDTFEVVRQWQQDLWEAEAQADHERDLQEWETDKAEHETEQADLVTKTTKRREWWQSQVDELQAWQPEPFDDSDVREDRKQWAKKKHDKRQADKQKKINDKISELMEIEPQIHIPEPFTRPRPTRGI